MDFEDAFEKYSFDPEFDFNMPSGEDGLTVIERRIIYEMMKREGKSFQSCSDVLLSVLKKMRNNIDSYISRLGRSNALRYPMFNIKGNFGNECTGDSPSAPAFKEIQLNDLSNFFTVNVEDENQFVENEIEAGYSERGMEELYSNSKNYSEPLWLDTVFPYLLCNGASDVDYDAYGKPNKESIILPHNIIDVTNAIKAYLHDENVSDEELICLIKGPDFPSGGIVSQNNLSEIYKTGQGKLILKGKYLIDGRKIVITELPYHVTDETFCTEVDKELKDFHLELNDYTSDKINIEIVLKNDIKPEEFLKVLEVRTSFRKVFDVQNRIMVNLEPQLVNLRQMIELYVNQRCKVLKGFKNEKYKEIEKSLDDLCKKIGDKRRSELEDF